MPLFAPQEVPRLLLVGAALNNVPVQKRKQKFWLHVRKKKRKTKKEQFVPLPKSLISTFDDDGQYPPVVVITLYSNHDFLALAT